MTMWKSNDVTQNHQLRFIEAIQELPFDLMNQVIKKELEELKGNKAQI